MRSYVARAVEMLSEYEPSEYRTALVNLCAYIAEDSRVYFLFISLRTLSEPA